MSRVVQIIRGKGSKGDPGSGFAPIASGTLLGNSSGLVAAPIARTPEQMGLIGVNSPIVRSLQLTQKSANSGGDWGPRDGAIIAFLGNSAFLIGGWAGAPYDTDWNANGGGTTTNQIYRTDDFGANWSLARSHDLTPATDHIPQVHTPAWTMHSVSGTEYVYLLCGDPFVPFSDVYRSSNGTIWAKVNSVPTPYDGVYLASGGSIDGKLYVAGGHTTLLAGSARNTVYKSTTNGATWTQLANAPWASRFCLDRMPAWKGKLWVVGGGKYDNDANNRVYYNDVWAFDPDTETWEEILPNGQAPWEARTYANIFVAEDWLYVSRGYGSSNTNLSDTWRTADGKNWVEVDWDLPASHADGLGIHSTGVLIASGNHWLGGSPVNTDSPSYFASVEDQTAQESIAQLAHEVAKSYNVPFDGIIREAYTEGSNPRALNPGNNAKLLQINAPNYNEGQPDKNIIGAYVTNGSTYVLLGGGLDNTKECAQVFSVYLGADNTLLGQIYFNVDLNGSSFKENGLGIGVAAPSQGIDLQAITLRLGANEADSNLRTANAAKVCNVDMPNYANSAVVQIIGGYMYAGGKVIYFGGGLNFNEAADSIEFWTTPNNTLGTRRMRVNSSGLLIDNNLDVTGSVSVGAITKSALLSLTPATNAGERRITDSTPPQRRAYPDGTNWRYSDDSTIVI